MTREEYLDALLGLPNRGWSTPSVSPDGAWVAWTWLGQGPTADVYAAPTDAAGIAYNLLPIADEGHSISRRANRRTLYLRLVDFFAAAFDAAPV